MSIMKVTAKWTGFSGAPGYSNFYFDSISNIDPTTAEMNDAFGRVDQFFIDIMSLFPPAAKIQLQGEVPLINPVDGKMSGMLTRSAGSVRSGTGAAGGYSAASGAVVTWRTGVVVAGRLLRGRTFLVPTVNVAYGLDGTLQATTQTTLSTAANKVFATHATLRALVWARPAKERVKKDGTVVPARTGDVGQITSASVPPVVAVLRSRRD